MPAYSFGIIYDSPLYNKNVIIKADKNLTHGVIVDIMTRAKNAGAESLDIATESETK